MDSGHTPPELPRAKARRALAFALTLCWVQMIAFAPPAQAQLPAVQVPNLPRVELPTTVNDTLGRAGDTVGNVAGRLTDLRRLRVDELLRTQRAGVERDPAGQPILRAEVVSLDPSSEALDRARSAGFEIARERVLEGLEARVVVLRAPEGMTTRRALRRLRDIDPQGTYDYNHIYLDSGEVADSRGPGDGIATASPRQAASAGAGGLGATMRVAAIQASAASGSASGDSAPSIKVGLVDGGVDVTHPVFKNAVVHSHGCDGRVVPSAHGTAVASLIAGKSDPFNGAAPGAELYAADVYCGVGTGGAVDAIVDAIAWIAGQRVAVINVSLVGPRNVMLESVVKLVIARGHVIVAAVGNDGPAAPPLYPASYPDVVGVTGVDARRKVLLEACRGKQVDFAAPGSDMAAANLSPTFAAVRGTSFAAPIVAGLLAASLHEPDRARAARAVEELTRNAVDLGSRGVDKTYGAGLVGDSLRTTAALALVSAHSGPRTN
jgi:subtilisin family serine protease